MAGSILGGLLGGGGGGGSSGLVGGLLGGSAGGITGLIGGFAARRSAADLRYQIRGGILGGQAETARQVAGIVGSKEFLTGAQFLRSLYGIQGGVRADLARQLGAVYGPEMFGIGAKGYNPATAAYNQGLFQSTFGVPTELTGKVGQAQAALDLVNSQGLNKEAINATKAVFGIGGTEFGQWGLEGTKTALQQRITNLRGQVAQAEQASQGIIPGTAGTEPTMDPLSQQFVSQLQKAQLSRGLYNSQAAASAEASGLAAFKTNLQLQYLPQLMKLASAPQDIASALEVANLNRQVQMTTGGQTVYGAQNAGAADVNPWVSALQGATAGFTGGYAAGTAYGAGQQVAPRPASVGPGLYGPAVGSVIGGVASGLAPFAPLAASPYYANF